MLHKLNYDVTDLIFRILFSLIFLGLGLEHLFSDEMIQSAMPHWLSFKRQLSLVAGILLLTGGLSILLGFYTTWGAILLGGFLTVVTILIHLPGLWSRPENLPDAWRWLWDVYQQSNLVKNLCLIGVCFHLINHRPGRYSLDARFGLAQGP